MRLTILKSGMIRTWRHLVSGEHHERERIDVPVPFFVIEHDEKIILFDAGQTKPAKPQPEDAKYITLMDDEDFFAAQLKKYGFAPEKITHVILSHAHGDHFGGLAELGNIECIIQQKETETSTGGNLLKTFPSKKWRIIDGRTDIFRDGRIIAVPTYGHTAGHQSLLLTLDDGQQVCMASDALYMDCALEDDIEIRYSSVEAVELLRDMHRNNVIVISGHDPSSFDYLQNYFNKGIKNEKV
jgi:glyoxylase-like metal-dependent hydrolase (beta-lactamase superfamily II)